MYFNLVFGLNQNKTHCLQDFYKILENNTLEAVSHDSQILGVLLA